MCHRLYQLGNGGDSVTCVAKMFKRKVSSKAYFDEALTQVVAECFAQEFNRQEKYRIAFLPAAVMALKDRNDQLLGVEPLMKGEYKSTTIMTDTLKQTSFYPRPSPISHGRHQGIHWSLLTFRAFPTATRILRSTRSRAAVLASATWVPRESSNS